MKNVLGFLAASFAGIAGIVAILGRKEKKTEKKTSGITVLTGEFIDAVYDRDAGLTRVEVRDTSGVTQVGFSALSEKELTALYAGKGIVQVVTQTR